MGLPELSADRPGMLSVLHVCPSVTRTAGGLFTAVSGLVRAQMEIGVRAAVLGATDEYLIEDQEHWGNTPIAAFRAYRGYGLAGSAFREVMATRAHLLHVHGIWSATSSYARLAQLIGLPVVVSPHGMLDPWILSRRRLVKQIHAAVLERPVLRNGYVHALNESERSSILSFQRLPEDRVRVFPNGIDEKVLPLQSNRRRGFLYLGRLHPKKQVKELVAAWLAAGVPDEEPLLVAGWGEPAYEAEIRAAAKGSSKVRFLGPLYGEPKTEALLGARAFILPSLSEGLPMAVLEALQHGCMPIITEQCNLPELFRDCAAVRLEADLSNLRQTIARALEHSDDSLIAQAEFLSTYSRRYLWSEIADKMSSWYRAIVGRRRSGRTAAT